MRKLMIGLMAFSMLGLASVSQAKSQDKGHAAKSQATEHMSEQGVANANSPSSGDQVKGELRADERKAMQHENQSTERESKGQPKARKTGQARSKKSGKQT